MKIVCAGLAALFAGLCLLGRLIKGRAPEEVRGILRPFWPAAAALYDLVPGLPGRSRVKKALAILYPSRSLIGREKAYYIQKLSRSLLAMGACLVLSLAAALSGGQKPLEDGALVREEAGGMGREVLVRARTGEGEDLGTYPLTVSPRQRTKEECEKLAGDLEKALPGLITGGNASLDHVTEDLSLFRSLPGYPFSVSWQSSDYSLVGETGKVRTDRLEPGETKSLDLTARLTCGSWNKEIKVPVTLVRKEAETAREAKDLVPDLLARADRDTAESDRVLLPDRAGRVTLTWALVEETPALPLLVLSPLLFFLLYAGSDLDLEKKTGERNREMERAYPGLVSRFSLCLGAGMSIRTVFYRMGEDYRKEKEAGGQRREVFEEILLVCHALDSGISEPEACLLLARRCRNPSYTRFCSLLAQNMKKGNKALLEALRQEAVQAERQRKDLARKLGEEAATRLLVPMMLMLAVTLVMIMVPAWFSF